MGLIEFNVITKKISPNRRVSCIFGLYIWFKWTITAGKEIVVLIFERTSSLKETNLVFLHSLIWIEFNRIELKLRRIRSGLEEKK